MRIEENLILTKALEKNLAAFCGSQTNVMASIAPALPPLV